MRQLKGRNRCNRAVRHLKIQGKMWLKNLKSGLEQIRGESIQIVRIP